MIPCIFQMGSQLVLYGVLATLLLLLPLGFRNLLQLEYHLYVGTVSYSKEVRLFVEVQQLQHEQLCVNVYRPVEVC